MKRLLRNTLSDLSYRTIRLTNGKPHGVRILTYHRVNDWHPNDVLSVPTARFKEQMAYLKTHDWQVWPLSGLVQWLNSERRQARGAGRGARGAGDNVPTPPVSRPLPPRAVVITFDDGYADTYWNASPVLQEHGFCATLFVASGFMGRYVPLPRYAGGSVERDRGLTLQEIRTMQAHGVEIGAHTVMHPDLTAMTPEAARREIVESKRQIEQETGRPVQAFAYPKGRWNRQVAALVREAGFASACSERIGPNRLGEDVFRLRRTEISAFDTLDDFEKKLSGAFDILHHAAKVFA